MAKTKKKEVAKCYVIDEKAQEVRMYKSDIVNLTPEDNSVIGFYIKTLEFDMCWIEEEEKVRKTFKVENAITYIKRRDKEFLKEFNKIKDKANKKSEEVKKLNAAAKAAAAENATEADKAAAPTEEALKAAKKDMIDAQREAYLAQKEAFIEKFGEDAYETVKEMA